jgi:hypothetical protein
LGDKQFCIKKAGGTTLIVWGTDLSLSAFSENPVLCMIIPVA